MKHAGFQGLLLHMEKITCFKVAFPALLGTGMKWQRELVIPGQKEDSAGTIGHWDPIQMDCQPCPGLCLLSLPPSGSPSSCTELTQGFLNSSLHQHWVCLSCYLLWSKNWNSCMSQLTGNKTCSWWALSQPHSYRESATMDFKRGRKNTRTPELYLATLCLLLTCNLLSATYSINPSSSTLTAKL